MGLHKKMYQMVSYDDRIRVNPRFNPGVPDSLWYVEEVSDK